MCGRHNPSVKREVAVIDLSEVICCWGLRLYGLSRLRITVTTPVEPFHVVSLDFGHIPLRAVLGIICPGLDAPLDRDLAALVHVPGHIVCGLPPRYHGDEVSVVCAVLILTVALHRHGEVRAGDATLGRAGFDIPGDVADDYYTINKSFLLIFGYMVLPHS